ncbi:hypothetical protein LMH87_009543 [Akanthomyces muscarius]|uniref:Uncharacterized protein n=1 Tax=Akanthomyces muscarius TaxID=2231603 RepID=A0A9W8QC78_AKAMU|nr:hypothetical protein LMH87_009543 [Akanthomyces muscarius]KAJ4153032.1 hypothetical protein LMH87_009543 [Akanthomyces muscarius]
MMLMLGFQFAAPNCRVSEPASSKPTTRAHTACRPSFHHAAVQHAPVSSYSIRSPITWEKGTEAEHPLLFKVDTNPDVKRRRTA